MELQSATETHTGMHLEKVPQILQQLKRIKGIRKPEHGNARFAGQIAVDEGMANSEQLNAALLAQVVTKSMAAEKDLELIAMHGKQDHAKWLAANWGNKGVNKASKQPSIIGAATAATANIAQNIVMLVNETNVELAKDQEIQMGVSAAAQLARFISGNERLSIDHVNVLRNTTMAGLRKAANGVELHDSQNPPHPINLDDFIKERQIEINRGIDERIRLQPHPQENPNTSASAAF